MQVIILKAARIFGVALTGALVFVLLPLLSGIIVHYIIAPERPFFPDPADQQVFINAISVVTVPGFLAGAFIAGFKVRYFYGAVCAFAFSVVFTIVLIVTEGWGVFLHDIIIISVGSLILAFIGALTGLACGALSPVKVIGSEFLDEPLSPDHFNFD